MAANDQVQRLQLERALALGQRLLRASEHNKGVRVPVMRGRIVGIQLEGAPELLLGGRQVPVIKKMNHRQGAVRFRQRAVDLQRLEGGGLRFRHGLPRRQPAHGGRSAQRPVAVGETGVGGRIAGIGGDRPLEIPERLLEGHLGLSIEEVTSPQVVLVGLRAHRTGARQAGLRVRRQLESDGPGDGPRDVALQDQDVAEVALIRLGPHVGLVDGLDQLSGDAHALTGAAEASLQDVVRAQLLAEPADVPVGVLVFPGGAARGDPQPVGFQSAELRDHLLRQAVTQVFLVRVAGEVVEGKDGERQPLARRGARPRTPADPIGDQGRGREHGRDDDQATSGRRQARRRGRRRRSHVHVGYMGQWRRGPRLCHRGDEPVTPPREGLDVTGGLGRVAQGLPQLPHGRVEAVVEVDERVRGPELVPQLLSGHHLARPLQEQGQQAKRLILQTDLQSLPAQLPGREVDLKGPEAEDPPRGSRLRHGVP